MNVWKSRNCGAVREYSGRNESVRMRMRPPPILLVVLLAVFFAGSVVSVVSATSPDSLESGKKIFEEKCMMCHGEKGDGQKVNGVDFSSKDSG